jgi:hypothetical protein
MKYISWFIVVGIYFFAFNFLNVGEINECSASQNRYDLMHIKTYQAEGNSMSLFGFADRALISVVPANEFRIGDIVAFECYHEGCDGAYIKKIVKKQNNCYWLEGRRDIWKEFGIEKESLDSRTTYGWLCGDEIEIYGVAFLKNDQKLSLK